MSSNETTSKGASTHWSVYLGIGMGGVLLVLASLGFVWISKRNRVTIETVGEMVVSPSDNPDYSLKTMSVVSEDTASIAPFEIREFEFMYRPNADTTLSSSFATTPATTQNTIVSFEETATQMKDLSEVPKAQSFFRRSGVSPLAMQIFKGTSKLPVESTPPVDTFDPVNVPSSLEQENAIQESAIMLALNASKMANSHRLSEISVSSDDTNFSME